MVKKVIEYWEVTIKCLVRKEDINNNSMSKKDVEESMDLEFDQIEYTDKEVKIV